MNYGYAAGPPRQIKELLRYVRSSKGARPLLDPAEMQHSICVINSLRNFVLTALQHNQRTVLLRLPVMGSPWDTLNH